MNRIKAGIVFGGRSGEHDVSIVSASSVVNEIDKDKYHLFLFGITKKGGWRFLPISKRKKQEDMQSFLKRILKSGQKCSPLLEDEMASFFLLREKKKIKIDVIFPVLHGTFGEDGAIQGLFEMMNIPYVGSGVLGSSAGMDKDIMKHLFKAKGLNVVPWVTFYQGDSYPYIKSEVKKKLKFPVFVKPANLGSSVGISKVKTMQKLEKALKEAFLYDHKIIVEQGVDAREIECSILGNFHLMASVPGEIIPKGDSFYSYKAKYKDTGSTLVIPADLSDKKILKIQQLAIEAFRAVEAMGMARVDFFIIKKTNKIIVNELNTIPGFTSISMFPKLFSECGLKYSELIDELFHLALDIYEIKNKRKF
ncbi:MAG: D-alanine--D-alanine ligase [Candidatus Aureabacteria bacterium]|nr:D-alanine--D-alanine ligase [Candidatus Auribacterota bacterium]